MTRHSFPMDEETRILVKKKHALSKTLVRDNNESTRRQNNKIRNKVKGAVKKLKKKF